MGQWTIQVTTLSLDILAVALSMSHHAPLAPSLELLPCPSYTEANICIQAWLGGFLPFPVTSSLLRVCIYQSNSRRPKEIPFILAPWWSRLRRSLQPDSLSELYSLPSLLSLSLLTLSWLLWAHLCSWDPFSLRLHFAFFKLFACLCFPLQNKNSPVYFLETFTFVCKEQLFGNNIRKKNTSGGRFWGEFRTLFREAFVLFPPTSHIKTSPVRVKSCCWLPQLKCFCRSCQK